mgnify:CR=1 FL=1
MEEKFDVTGMTCAACQANVTRVVSKLDGVSHCDVSLLSNSMKVEFDQNKVNEQVICEAVKQIGIEWCIQQSKELVAAGIPVLHYYSMGKAENVKAIAREIF